MPADVALRPGCLEHLEVPRPRHHHHHQQSQQQGQQQAQQQQLPGARSGRLLFAAGGEPVPVRVTVYRTSAEHFAVVEQPEQEEEPEPAGSAIVGVLSLRGAQVERCCAGRRGIVVRQQGLDSPVALSFLLPEAAQGDDEELERWFLAFAPRSSPLLHRSCLPSVQEDEEQAA